MTRPLAPDQQDLAARYVPLARKLARQGESAFPSLAQECESAALWALTLAARDYDLARGVTFVAYARPRIVGAILDALRMQLPKGFRDKRQCQDGRPSVVRMPIDLEIAADSRPVGADLEAFEEFEACCRRVPEKHGRVLRERFRNGRSQRETAGAMGVSQSRVCELEKQSMAMLRGAGA